MKSIRLDALLASRNFGSRKEALLLIKTGAVLVNGARAVQGGQKIDPDLDRVTVNGAQVSMREFIYIMLYKPAGTVSAARDPNAAAVPDLLPAHIRRRGLFPAGRLDKDTTGLLLVTNDGALAHALLSPKRHVEKVYLAALREPVRPEDITAFAAGLVLPAEDGRASAPCMPAGLEILPGNRARVTLREGKYHQVKRMFRAVGNEVLALHRERFGPLQLDMSLRPGECRELTAEELKKLEAFRRPAPL